MILQSLNDYYERMLQDPDRSVPERFWSTENVGWEFEIDGQGNLISVLPLTSGSKNQKRSSMSLQVPEHDNRTSGKKAFFLCDNAAYLLGLDDKEGEAKCALSRDLHLEVLGTVDDPAAQAICEFFEKVVKNRKSLSAEKIEELKRGDMVVFRLKNDTQRIHERAAIKKAWSGYRAFAADDDVVVIGQCAVTGKRSPMARLFPQVTGIRGAKSAGASLVSFNKESFESYGKKQTYNASISTDVAFNAGSALRYLYGDANHYVRYGDTTFLFWTDRPASNEEEWVSQFLGDTIDLRSESKSDLEKISHTLNKIKAGLPLEDCNPEVRFFILGVSPNAARLAVHFFEVDTFGALMRRYGEYLNDIEMVGVKPVSLRTLLRQTAPQGDADAIPSTLINSCVSAMLTGSRFPRGLLQSLLTRTRADHASNNIWDMGQRAALIKAYLVRQERFRKMDTKHDDQEERSFKVALDRQNKDEAYCLGRLFAVLERAQAAAVGEINATIKDRYFGAASTTPSRVFPALIRNSANHFAKLRKENSGLCVMLEKETNEIFSVAAITSEFPKTLSFEKQGAFFLGYHQEKADLWTSKKKDTKDAVDEESL